MELTIIGSGTGIPSRTRAYPCTLLKLKDEYMVFDTGPGSLRQLFLAGVTYLDIDYICYSHFHPDHSLDLVSFLFAMRYNDPGRIKPLHVIGPSGLKAFYERLLMIYGDSIKPRSFELYFKEIDNGRLSFDNFEITVETLKHSMHSIGFRIESSDGKALVYSGDTDFCEEIVRLSKNVNTLILECSFPDDQKVEGHLTPSLCARIAEKSGCKRLILTHFYPICDSTIHNNKELLNDLKNIYDGEIIFADDFSVFII